MLDDAVSQAAYEWLAEYEKNPLKFLEKIKPTRSEKWRGKIGRMIQYFTSVAQREEDYNRIAKEMVQDIK